MTFTALVTLGLLLVASSAEAATTTKCNADNCARAVTGTLRAQTASHFADCQSFFACTVTPAVSTATATVTLPQAVIASTVTAGNFPEGGPSPANKRQATAAAGGAVTNCPSAVPAYASPCSGTARFSSACSCFGAKATTVTAPQSTTTVTTTVTPVPSVSVTTVAPPVPTTCGNEGLQWAYFVDNSFDDGFDSEQVYDPAQHKADTPVASGVTSSLHFSLQDGNVYGNSELPNTRFALEHRGYLFAPESGTYTFAVTNVDNAAYAWIGSKAYSGWTGNNADQHAFYNAPPGGLASSTFTADLVAGTYVPFRLVYWQGYGGGAFDYSITAPSGFVLVGPNPGTSPPNPFVLQYSCDGMLAPQYPPFGQET